MLWDGAMALLLPQPETWCGVEALRALAEAAAEAHAAAVRRMRGEDDYHQDG